MLYGFDTETHLIRPGLLAPPMVCYTESFARTATQGTRDSIYLAADEALEDAVRGRFNNIERTLVGANTAYDAGVLLAWRPSLAPSIFNAYTEGRVWCVQINQQLIDLAQGKLFEYGPRGKKKSYSLASLVLEWFGEDRTAEKLDPNGWRLRYAELEHVSLEQWPQDAVDYAIQDAVDARRVCEAQLDKYRDLFEHQAAAQARAQLCLHLLSVEGVHTDRDTIEALRELTAQRFADLTANLIHAGLVRPDGSRDTKMAKQRMIDACVQQGIPWNLTKTGLEKATARKKDSDAEHGPKLWDYLTPVEREKYVALDEVACEESCDDVLEMYAKRTSLAGIVNTHIPDLLRGVDTPLQASWVTLVDSGRISCRKPTGGSSYGTQLTNQARGLEVPCDVCGGTGCKACKDTGEMLSEVDTRACYVAEPGLVFVDKDFPGLELSTVAQACKVIVGYSRLGEALLAGIDVHLLLASRLLGVSYEEAVRRKHEPEVKHARQTAKPGNFGFWGGMGPEGFVRYARKQGVRVTKDKAAEIKAAWQEEFPETRAYFAHIRELCSLEGTATITQLYSGRVCAGMAYTEACNRYFQGLGADAAKDALYAVTRACYDPTQKSIVYGSRPWNFVHDQIITKVADVRDTSFEERKRRHDVAMELAQLMTDAANVYLPDFPLKVAPALSYAWRKDAEGVVDEDGLLLPYDYAKAAKATCFYLDGKAVAW